MLHSCWSLLVFRSAPLSYVGLAGGYRTRCVSMLNEFGRLGALPLRSACTMHGLQQLAIRCAFSPARQSSAQGAPGVRARPGLRSFFPTALLFSRSFLDRDNVLLAPRALVFVVLSCVLVRVHSNMRVCFSVVACWPVAVGLLPTAQPPRPPFTAPIQRFLALSFFGLTPPTKNSWRALANFLLGSVFPALAGFG